MMVRHRCALGAAKPAVLRILLLFLASVVLTNVAPDAIRQLRGRAYAAARGVEHARALLSVEGWSVEESGLARLYYTKADADIAGEAAAFAGEAYMSVCGRLGYDAPGELTVIMYPSFESLQRAVAGGEGGEGGRSIGVCWAGIVGMVSPKAWGGLFGSGDAVHLFGRYNPLHHEIAHYVLDEMADGNYPRWFSEGLAQVVEFDATGYVWEETEALATDGGVDLSLGVLDRAFNREDTLNAVYSKSMWVTDRIMKRLEGPGFARLAFLLGRGMDFEVALREVSGLDYGALESEWRER